jgi:signal transduction histidine kinase
LSKCDYFGFIDENVYFLIRIRQYYDINGKKIILFVRDIRRMKDLEESVEFTNYKNLLVASASHEFRTPLNGILGMLTLLNLFVSEEGKHLLKVASDSANFLMCLINDMLDFSQLESKSLKINYTSFEVKKMLEEIRDLVSYQPQSRGVSLILEISDKIPKYASNLDILIQINAALGK